MNVLKDPDSHPVIFKMLRMLDLGEFNSTYRSLASLLARLRRSSQTPSSIYDATWTNDHPEDPNRSGGSTSSTESKQELYAQNVASSLLEDTYSTVAEWMSRFEWINPDSKLYLYPQYDTILFELIIRSAVQRMEIRIGRAQSITAIDDGGVSMNFRRDPASSQLSQRVILSIEVTPPLTIVLTIRQNVKSMLRKRTKTLQIAMPLKYTPKCLVKYVIPNSTN